MGFFSRRDPDVPVLTSEEVALLVMIASTVDPTSTKDPRVKSAIYKAQAVVTKTENAEKGTYHLHIPQFYIH